MSFLLLRQRPLHVVLEARASVRQTPSVKVKYIDL